MTTENRLGRNLGQPLGNFRPSPWGKSNSATLGNSPKPRTTKVFGLGGGTWAKLLGQELRPSQGFRAWALGPLRGVVLVAQALLPRGVGGLERKTTKATSHGA